MQGERLENVRAFFDGLEGDRILQVRDGRDKTVTSRTKPGLLRHKSVLGPDGNPLVDGRPWNDPSVAKDVQQAAGNSTRLVFDKSTDRFDILPLLVATDGALAEIGEDTRRFRRNLVIGGVEGMAERGWEDKWLRVGEVLIGIANLRGRCIMTTFDPDTGVQDKNLLKRIYSDYDGVLALNASVAKPGVIRVGDPVELFESLTSARGNATEPLPEPSRTR